MTVRVLRPGVLSTLQDGGRFGYRAQGIGPGGAMDEVAHQLANALVGNPAGRTVLEFFQPGPELLFESDALIAAAGPGCRIFMDDVPVPTWHPVRVAAGTVVRLEQSSGGTGYLAIHGGWAADEWLGRCSTNLTVGLGGHHGRALRKDDRLQVAGNFRLSGEGSEVLRWSVPGKELALVYDMERHILCLPGPESRHLDQSLLDRFSSQAFQVGRDSNRMGYRLSGAPLMAGKTVSMISSPVVFGTVQLLPGGQVIVLMADHQTTGGYPRLACLIRTEWPRFVQLSDGRPFFFAWTSPDLAMELLVSRKHWLAQVERSCLLNLAGYIYET